MRNTMVDLLYISLYIVVSFFYTLKNPDLLDPTRAASSHLYRGAIIYLTQVVLPSQLSRAGQK